MSVDHSFPGSVTKDFVHYGVDRYGRAYRLTVSVIGKLIARADGTAVRTDDPAAFVHIWKVTPGPIGAEETIPIDEGIHLKPEELLMIADFVNKNRDAIGLGIGEEKTVPVRDEAQNQPVISNATDTPDDEAY